MVSGKILRMFHLFEIIIANVLDQLMYRRLKFHQSINLVEFDLRFASADLKSFPEWSYHLRIA